MEQTDVKFMMKNGQEVYVSDLDIAEIDNNGNDTPHILIASVKEGLATAITLKNVDSLTFIEWIKNHETKEWTSREFHQSVKELREKNLNRSMN